MNVFLSEYNNKDFSHGKSKLFRFLWMVISNLFFDTWVPYHSKMKVILLRFFGAKIGKNVIIRPNVRIKQPWCLAVGDNVWIGESVWIDNLVQVTMHSDVCLSQGAVLLTGNHDYKSKSFELLTGEIFLESGVWIGAKAMVGPGVRCYSHSVLSAGSITFKDTLPYYIYQGNPAEPKRKRLFKVV